MKKQAYNPFLPSWEYIPDGEPYLIDGRVYVFGSHDKFGGGYFCLNDYVCWSAPVNDLGNWKFEGVIYKKEQDPLFNERDNVLFAPDVVQGKDGRWYLYYTLASNGIMSVAVSSSPAGKYEYLGAVRAEDGHILGTKAGDVFQFDPGIIVDGDKILLYSGFSPRPGKDCDTLMQGRKGDGAYCMELDADMLTVKSEPVRIAPGICCSEDTSFEQHPFFEASSIRKIGNKYYFVYSSTYGHELCYAMSDRPDGGFVCKGVLVSNGDVGIEGRRYGQAVNYMGNNHGGLVRIGGEWYIFYHRHTNRSSYSRQACAERIEMDKDGLFLQAEMTSCGLNNVPLRGEGYYPAYIACQLYSKDGACFSEDAGESAPFLTQSGGDRENGEDQYIANLQDGSVAGFKYFDLRKTREIGILLRGSAEGKMTVTDGKTILACADVVVCGQEKECSVPLAGTGVKIPLYFCFTGKGAADLIGFTLR